MGTIMVHLELYRILVMQVVPVNGQQQLLIQQPQGSNQQPQIIQVINRHPPGIRASSVADPGCLYRIPDPTFFHPGSQIRNVSIPDPGS
jgi:hypothetical protein